MLRATAGLVTLCISVDLLGLAFVGWALPSRSDADIANKVIVLFIGFPFARWIWSNACRKVVNAQTPLFMSSSYEF